MSMLSALRTPYGYEDAFQAKDRTTQAMRKAILDWFRLYYGKEATEREDPCQQIAFTVVNKLTKTAFGEYKASSDDAFAQSVLDALNKRKEQGMQLALIGGASFLKPFPAAGGFAFSVVSRNNILVFGRDAQDNITDIGTAEETVEGSRYYTLLERRTLDAGGRLTIRNMLYRSDMPGVLGQKVSLQGLARYEALPEEYTYPQPLHSLGLVPVRVPLENCVDGSPDSVSVYAPAVGLIHNINRNEALLNGEFERGQSRVFAPSHFVRRRPDGSRGLDDHLFIGMDGDKDEVGGVTIFSPVLREQSFLSRKTEYLRNVENVIGIKRGLLSEVEAAERTATEVTSSAGDYNLTIIDIQRMWESAVREAVRLCGVLGQLYRVPGAHEVAEDAATIDWGNGVLYDEDKTWADYLDMVARGLLKPEIAIGWRFNMPTKTPKDLAKIREKYMPETEQLADGGDT